MPCPGRVAGANGAWAPSTCSSITIRSAWFLARGQEAWSGEASLRCGCVGARFGLGPVDHRVARVSVMELQPGVWAGRATADATWRLECHCFESMRVRMLRCAVSDRELGI
mmetsp:Transcript_51956/g.143945  ORF Transcript_51956/g.143945 Transcript_51956/m.143945 type:complete len:111 (+) Transcript_51956:217-549(+)